MTSSTSLLPQPINLVRLPSRRVCMTGCLVASDVLSLLTAVGVGIFFKAIERGYIDLSSYVRLWPFLFVFIFLYAAAGLYSGVALSAPEELRRATFCSIGTFVSLAALTVSLRAATSYFTWTLFVALAFSIGLFPALRALLRRMIANQKWWGYPTVVFGTGTHALYVVQAMLKDPGIGLKPIAVVDDSSYVTSTDFPVPVIGTSDMIGYLAGSGLCVYAVITAPLASGARALDLIERQSHLFSHTLLIPEIGGFSNLWVNPKNVGSMLGLEVQPHLSSFRSQTTKRALDIFLIALAMPFLLPAVLALLALIRFDSKGAAIYRQRRLGRNGKVFEALKFRSMVENADEALEAYLAGDSGARQEWELYQKVRNDVRITRMGRFLRKTSLDELPQLWNVVKGEMSLVGPRPIVTSEVPRYGVSFDLYKKVSSGLTGLWQVSGRNDMSYEERVNLDVFYVRNWSVWLDLCILFRTVETICFRRGAY